MIRVALRRPFAGDLGYSGRHVQALQERLNSRMTTAIPPLAPAAAARAAFPLVVRVPGGRFRMGSAAGRPDERPLRTLSVGAFELALTPVTCGQYARFVRSTGAAPPPCFAQSDFSHPEQPVTSVTWFEAAAYAEWLGTVLGGRFRLPSEAEWERAARGGLHGAATAWGATPPVGEVPTGSLRGPWRVGRGVPNAYGLFDMGTIVHEWCGDWYAADAYARAPEGDPRGPAEGLRRASRGGSWRHRVRWSSPAARSSLPPEFRYSDYGFRIVKEVP